MILTPSCEEEEEELATSGKTWIVATYRNVPALNKRAKPVACKSDRVSLLC